MGEGSIVVHCSQADLFALCDDRRSVCGGALRSAGHARAQIFSPHLAGSRAGSGGVWAGGQTTNTRQSSTLFVTNLDNNVPLEQVAALFDKEPGQ